MFMHTVKVTNKGTHTHTHHTHAYTDIQRKSIGTFSLLILVFLDASIYVLFDFQKDSILEKNAFYELQVIVYSDP